jgi:TnpA family transposase
MFKREIVRDDKRLKDLLEKYFITESEILKVENAPEFDGMKKTSEITKNIFNE